MMLDGNHFFMIMSLVLNVREASPLALSRTIVLTCTDTHFQF